MFTVNCACDRLFSLSPDLLITKSAEVDYFAVGLHAALLTVKSDVEGINRSGNCLPAKLGRIKFITRPSMDCGSLLDFLLLYL